MIEHREHLPLGLESRDDFTIAPDLIAGFFDRCVAERERLGDRAWRKLLRRGVEENVHELMKVAHRGDGAPSPRVSVVSETRGEGAPTP